MGNHGGQAELYAIMAILAGLSVPSHANPHRDRNSENPKGHRARIKAKKKHKKAVARLHKMERRRK